MFRLLTSSLAVLAVCAIPAAARTQLRSSVPQVAPPLCAEASVVAALEDSARGAAEAARQASGPDRGFDRALSAIAEALQQADFDRARAEQTVRGSLEQTWAKIERGAESSYERGLALLDRGQYETAIEAFNAVIKSNSSKVEGAMYWKAYAQNRLGLRADALSTLDAMLKVYPNGRWTSDARALQVEVRQAAGQPVRPDQETDDELKLIALNSLMRSDAEQVVPMLERLLQGPTSPRIKERALLVLALNPSPQARAILVEVAKGKANPDLQAQAVDHLGTLAGPESIRLLVEIYRGTTDTEVKRRVIRSLVGGSSAFYGSAYRYYQAMPPAQTDAGTGRGVSSTQSFNTGFPFRSRGASDQSSKTRAAEASAAIWQLYQSESSEDLKREMLRSGLMAGDPDRLVREVIRTEKSAELRMAAVLALGMSRTQKTGELLSAVYREDKDPAVRKRIIDALAQQQNATALVQIARQETDLALKKEAVTHLSTMKSKEATDFMMELLKK